MCDELKYCVYVHTCMAEGPDKGKVYVGQTSQKPKIRWGIYGQKYKHCPDFSASIDRNGWDAFRHIVIADNLDKHEADRLEMDLISCYRSNDPRYGFNQTIGGSVLSGGDNPRARAVVVFDSISGARLGYFPSLTEAAKFTGKGKNSVFRCLSGECKTCGQYICRYAEDVYNIDVLPEEQRYRHRAQPLKEKPVDQFDKDGNYIRTFSSIQDAEKFLGLSRSSVGNAIRGASKTSGGYIWKLHRE